MGWLLIPWRLLRVLRRVLQGIWINATRLPHVDAPTRDAIVQRWDTQLLQLLDHPPAPRKAGRRA